MKIQLCSAGSSRVVLTHPTENVDYILYLRLWGLILAEFEGLITPGTGPRGVFPSAASPDPVYGRVSLSTSKTESFFFSTRQMELFFPRVSNI